MTQDNSTCPRAGLAVHATGLIKTFAAHRAVDGIDLRVHTGEILGVLGPNGAGKTTMLRMLATLLGIEGCCAEIFGVDVRNRPHVVRQLVGVTGQYASVAEDTPDALKNSVGDSTLQLLLDDPAQLSTATAAMRRVVADEPVLTPEHGRINLPIARADQAGDVLIALRSARVGVASVSVAKPSLDEVFLALTGHDTHAGEEPTNDESTMEVSR